jgi:hypothetical protein
MACNVIAIVLSLAALLASADRGYGGKLVTWARTRLKPELTLEIVKRPDDLHTFKALPRRANPGLDHPPPHHPRLRTAARHHETCLYWAKIIMTRRVARTPAQTDGPGSSPDPGGQATAAVVPPSQLRRRARSGRLPWPAHYRAIDHALIGWP